MVVDFFQLVRGTSKHGPVWWAALTLVFFAMALGWYVGGQHWLGYLWGSLALMCLIGLAIRLSRSEARPDEHGPSISG